MTAELEFPNGALGVGLEFAFGADIDGDQSAWTWTDVTPDGDSVFMSQTVTVTRGRQDEQSEVGPTSADMRLDNPDGDLTPDDPDSQYWPNVELGTPARWWVEYGDPRLALSPTILSKASVTDTPALDLSGDLDVRIDLHLKSMDAGGANAVIAGRANTGGGYSWRLEVTPDRRVVIKWSDDGTPPPDELTSTVPVLPSSARVVLRVTLDVDNGAGGHDATFYLGGSMSGPWTQVGPAVTGAGVTSIFNANEDLVVGAANDVPETSALDADIYAFALLDGIGGTPIADADFQAQLSGATTFVDAAGLTWDVGVFAQLSNIWYRIVGQVASWAPLWPWGDISAQIPGGLTEGEARTDIQIAGILRRLGTGQSPLQSPLRRSLGSLSQLQAYWPMEDGKESTKIASGVPGGLPGTVLGEVSFEDNDGLPGSKPLPTLGETGGFLGALTGATFTNNWQADWYVNIPTAPSVPRGILRIPMVGDPVSTWVVDVSAGAVTVTGLNSLGAVFVTQSFAPGTLFSGWHHLQLFFYQSGATVSGEFHWTPVTYPPSAGSAFALNYAGTIGVPVSWSVPPDVQLAGMSMGHLAFTNAFDLATSDDAATGWQGETAGERMARLTTEESIDFRIIGDPADTELMGPQRVETLLELLSDAADADGGILYEQRNRLGLVYRTRSSLYNQPTNMILDAHAEELQNPFAPVKDDQRIRNDVTVTRVGGSSYRVVDAASVDKSGTYDESVTLNLFSDSQLPGAASWRLHQGTVPGMRYPQVTTNLGAAPQIIGEWLTVDSGSRVDVVNLPPQHPTADVRVMAEGYSEPISPVTWSATLNCSPASVWDVGVLDGDGVDDDFLLRLETDASELDISIDATQTSVDVLVTEGPEWVTDPSEFPFDVAIGPERVTVTAIGAAAGGVQTFTVVRSVNGVVRAHAGGTDVHVWSAVVLAR